METIPANTPSAHREMKIRNFRSGEERLLGQVFSDALGCLEVGDDLAHPLEMLAPDEFDQAGWMDRIRKQRPYVAEVDGGIAGFATLGEPGTIEDFYVLPALAGSGVGDALLRHVEVMARRQELPALYANACLRAEPFFHQHGFSPERRGNSFFNGSRIPNTLMRKRLS